MVPKKSNEVMVEDHDHNANENMNMNMNMNDDHNDDEELGVVVIQNNNDGDDDDDDDDAAAIAIVGGGGGGDTNNSKSRTSSRVSKAASSFFLLNKNNNRTIPQIKITLEDVTYQPITSTATAAGASSSSSSSSLWKSLLWKSSSNDNGRKKEQQQNQNRTIVLNKINTTINPFELTAWMGPSGSGKTSLTSVVAGLISNDPNSNDITKESQIKCSVARQTALQSNSTTTTTTTYGSIPKQMIGVVWQDDLLLGNLTVEETIYFAARLKTPSSITDSVVTELVIETMKELNVSHIRHNTINTISGGERKRLSVGVELVTRPSLLICDEPTSGLDSSTAYKLTVTLKELTSLGHSIAIVIHQPRTDIFNMFDHLLLLSKGSVIYNGKPSLVRSYLENIHIYGSAGSSSSCVVHPLPPETGIADWIMDTIIDDEQNKNRMNDDDNCDGGSDRNTRYKSLADYWSEHEQRRSMVMSSSKDNNTLEEEGIVDSGDSVDNCEATTCNSNSNNTKTASTIRHRNNSSSTLIRRNGNKDENKAENNSSSPGSSNSTMYEATFWKELNLLINRITKQQRGERITRVSFLLMLTYLTFTSFMWWQIPDTTSNIFERNSLLFFILIAQGNSIVTSSISVFNRERTLLKRERSKKMYHVLPFFIAKMISDMTNNIALPLLYGIITYWTAGLDPSASRFFKFIVSYWFTLNCAQSLGFFLSILIPNMNIALILAPPITLFCFILGGFYIPFNNMHLIMKYISYTSFARYGYCSLLINEFEDRFIPCNSSEDDSSSSSGITVGDINECPLPGNNVYESIGINGMFANYWFNILILALFQMSFMIGAYVLLRRSK